MRRFLIITTALFSAITLFGQKDKDAIMASLDAQEMKYAEIAMRIWNWAEVGYQEVQSSALLIATLEKEGFAIDKGVAGIPTAFIAEYGTGKPVIAILAEYDALPGVSQKAIPEKEPVVEAGAGHACGHHLLGTASTAAGIEIKKWLASSKKSGTVRIYGTPAEEGGSGKVYMVKAGLFDDVDVALHWHPSNENAANPGYSLANKSAKFRFYGIASHASASPERGRSALDGVEAMNNMVNMLREHIPQDTRIHYVITHGGDAPNVVPAFAEVFYYVRNPAVDNVKVIFERVVKCAEGAALGTDTRMDYEVIHGLYNLLPNEALSKLMHANLTRVGGVVYDSENITFARKIQTTYDGDFKLEQAAFIVPYSINVPKTAGSTDVGDISWIVPVAGIGTATWVPGTSAHTWQAVAAGGTNIGIKGMTVAAKTIALTAIDIYNNPKITDKARMELLEKRGNAFKYWPLLGDREPPLDYRK
ncbi:MAG: amidohydrolase [Bacteroidetes bacterium]|nr:amidohydrolase [Bacteroidota bacterium]MDA1122233.1 amidohydrolase [Bacteroidota bacterium]